MHAVDERRWSDLSDYLHPEFLCTYPHTGETFDRAQWIQLNVDYPGFDRLIVIESVGDETAAACRSHVTGLGESGLNHFECATFVQMDDGRIRTMTEVWTDVAQQAPPGTRPTAESD